MVDKLIRLLSKPATCFLFIACVYVTGFLGHGLILKKTVYGDGVFYYSFLRSAIIDCDVSFSNEYREFEVSQPITPNGLPGNKYPIGPSLLWLPSFLSIRNAMPHNSTGYELPLQLAVGATSVMAALAGLVLLYRLLISFFPVKTALITIFATALATNLLFYGSVDPVNSHAPSFFAATVFLSLLLGKQKHWFFIGLWLGIMGIIRPQDQIMGMMAIPFLFPNWKKPFASVKPAMLLCAEWSIPILFQQTLYIPLYGTAFISPYFFGGEGYDFLHPHILPVLFSVRNGLFFTTPILLISMIGFFLPWKKNNMLKKTSAVVFLLSLYLVSSWSTWTQGASYGGRMFVSLLPLLAYPFAVTFSLYQKKVWQGYFIGWIITGMFFIMNAGRIVSFLLLSP